MRPEDSGLARDVGINVEHAPVIMAQNTQPVLTHAPVNFRRGHPLPDLFPGRSIFQITGDDVVTQPGPVEHVGDLRNGASLTVLQPHSGHPSPVAECIDLPVVDGGRRLQVQHDDGASDALGHGQNRRGETISGDIQKYEVHLPPGQQRRCRERLFGRIHHAPIDDLDVARSFDPGNDLRPVSVQMVAKTFELVPIRIESRSKEPDTGPCRCVFHKIIKCK